MILRPTSLRHRPRLRPGPQALPSTRLSLSTPRRLTVVLVASWAFLALPLLALPVDWEGICTCDACPFEGGPSCCCRRAPTWTNADGTPGRRVFVGLPDLDRQAAHCLETLAPAPARTGLEELAAQARLPARPAPAKAARAAEEPPKLLGHRRLPGLLPRPPPLDRRS